MREDLDSRRVEFTWAHVFSRGRHAELVVIVVFSPALGEQRMVESKETLDSIIANLYLM